MADKNQFLLLVHIIHSKKALFKMFFEFIVTENVTG